MNDRPPSGSPLPTDSAADSSHATYGATAYGQSPYGAYETGGHPVTGYDGYPTSHPDPSPYGGGDPLFGSLPDDGQGHDTGSHAHAGGWDTGSYATGSYATGSYDGADAAYATGAYATGPQGTGMYDTTWAYETGTYDTGSWGTGSWEVSATGGATGDTGSYSTGMYDAGAYDSGSWPHASADVSQTGVGQSDHAGGMIPPQRAAQEPGTHAGGEWSQGTYGLAHDPAVYDTDAYEVHSWESGSWDTTAWDTGSHTTAHDPAHNPAHSTATSYDESGYDETGYDRTAYGETAYTEQYREHGHEATPFYGDDPAYAEHAAMTEPALAEPGVPESEAEPEPMATAALDLEPRREADAGPGAGAPHREGSLSRGRRRPVKPRRRSALLTVAVPSVCVLGVAGIAAASVTGTGGGEDDSGEEKAARSAPDVSTAAAPGSAKPSPANDKLDTQLAGLSADADDFADRASRTQERIDLKERQKVERIRKEREAAAKEAARPKFAAPVDGTGVSAYYGQAGVNWMSLHSGMDFPAGYGTPVKAATDGTVSTKWGGAYGNMAIVTAADGTETWYCHLSSTKIRSGTVQAGDVIAFSGNSGNSTGPHLHFEVRPGGGSAIDPLPWFRSKGIEPG